MPCLGAEPKDAALQHLFYVLLLLRGELNFLFSKIVETGGHMHRLQLAGLHKRQLPIIDRFANRVHHQAFRVLRLQRAQRVFHRLRHSYGNFTVQTFVASQQVSSAVQNKPVRAGGGRMKRPFQVRDIDRHT